MNARKLLEFPMTPVECGRCAARHIGLFSDITGTERQRLLERLRHARGPSGTRLYSLGEAGHDLFIIRSGLIKLVQYASDGTARIVRLARPGDVIGLGILVRERHGHTAQALTTFDACRVPVDLVSHELDRINGLERKLFHQWQSAVEAADTFLTELSTGTAHERVARLFRYLIEHTDGAICPSDVLSRVEMGELLGITTETASRIVAEFRRAGILYEAGGECRCNLERLRAEVS